MKTALSIAGSDCSGGAGIQADLKTFSAHGVYGMTAVTSVVAENTFRVTDYQDVAPEIIAQQLDDIFEDIPPNAVKIGMLSNSVTMQTVAQKLRQWQPKNVVLDPVMYAKNGSPLMEASAIGTLLAEVVPLADVLTPNIPEAEKMTGLVIRNHDDMREAARRIHAMGCRAVVVKGGHQVDESGLSVDILFDGEAFYPFHAPRIDTKHTHGTGCTFSAAIAAQLALGQPYKFALAAAKRYITTAIQLAPQLGKGHGPTNHLFTIGPASPESTSRVVPDYSLYLVTDRAECVEQAILGGCTVVQLREKGASAADFYRTAQAVREITARHNIPLIINDRADIALAVGADGLHIGQSDLPVEAARRIMGYNKCIGVSVRTLAEAQEADYAGADYLGVGAMFPTDTKTDAAIVTMDELQRICENIHRPIVAIGGINRETLPLFAKICIDGVAVVSAITAHPDPQAATRELKTLWENQRGRRV